jgi:hypothetical protein
MVVHVHNPAAQEAYVEGFLFKTILDIKCETKTTKKKLKNENVALWQNACLPSTSPCV